MSARSAVKSDVEGVTIVSIEDRMLHGKFGLKLTKLGFFVVLVFFHCDTYDVVTVSNSQANGRTINEELTARRLSKGRRRKVTWHAVCPRKPIVKLFLFESVQFFFKIILTQVMSAETQKTHTAVLLHREQCPCPRDWKWHRKSRW